MLGVLEALDVLTPERLERIRRHAESTGAARVARAVRSYDDVVRRYKTRQAKPLELAHAHTELMAALEQNADEVRGVANRLVAVFRLVRGAKR